MEGSAMPKFLVQVKYTADGTKGVLKDGGSGRRKAVEEFMTSLGGTLDAFYFTLGEHDAVLIVDLPDTESALAVAMSVRASGAIHSWMTPLIPLDEVDRAVALHARYHPPGA
jgi:uncharacterized protein with GYD domain